MSSQVDEKERKKTFKILNRIKPEAYEPGMENELDFLRKKYQKTRESPFWKTSFFKKRLSVIIGLTLITFIAVALTPDNPDTVSNEFSYVMMITFLFLVAFIDQIIFGYYLFRKQSQNNKRDKVIE